MGGTDCTTQSTNQNRRNTYRINYRYELLGNGGKMCGGNGGRWTYVKNLDAPAVCMGTVLADPTCSNEFFSHSLTDGNCWCVPVDTDCAIHTDNQSGRNTYSITQHVPTPEPTEATPEPTDATMEPTASTMESTVSTMEPTEATQEPTDATMEPTASTMEPTVSTMEPTVEEEEYSSEEDYSSEDYSSEDDYSSEESSMEPEPGCPDGTEPMIRDDRVWCRCEYPNFGFCGSSCGCAQGSDTHCGKCGSAKHHDGLQNACKSGLVSYDCGDDGCACGKWLVTEGYPKSVGGGRLLRL